MMATSSAQPDTSTDRSEFRHILLSGTKVGVVTALAVVAVLLISRVLPPGVIRAAVQMLVVLAGAAAAAFLPAAWAVARGTQGIASAAAIGLWGTVVFMAIDIVLLRPVHAYPWTWDAVGGGSTWWYLPVWWMLGTFLAWMGAIVTAGRAARGGDTGIVPLAWPVLAGAGGVAIGLALAGLAIL
ncbi:MAG: hypothetical protein ACREMN_08300, partial [Gemmatimonadales bacterium]